MTNHAEHTPVRLSGAPHATKGAISTADTLHAEATALRDDAATLEFIARRWSRALPAGRTDVRADIALLKMIAGNARGFARTMEDAI